MGLFGPSATEVAASVRREAFATIDEVNHENDELREQIEAAQKSIDGLNRIIAMNSTTLDAYLARIGELTDQVRKGPIADAVQAAFDKMYADGELDFMADETVQEVVLKRAIDQAVASIANDMLTKREAEFRATIGPKELARIKADWHEVFSHDGTYERVEADVRAVVDEELQAELIAEERERQQALQASPEYEERRRREIAEDPAFQQEAFQLQQQLTAEYNKTLKARMLNEQEDVIQQVLQENGMAFIMQLADDIREQGITGPALRPAVDILSRDIITLMAAANEQIPDRWIYETYIVPFHHGHLELAALAKGLRLKVRLEGGYDDYGYRIKRSIQCRVDGDQKLVVLGDNGTVTKDLKRLAIGQVVSMGELFIDGGKRIIKPSLSPGMTFCLGKGVPRETAFAIESININSVDSSASRRSKRVDRVPALSLDQLRALSSDALFRKLQMMSEARSAINDDHDQ